MPQNTPVTIDLLGTTSGLDRAISQASRGLSNITGSGGGGAAGALPGMGGGMKGGMIAMAGGMMIAQGATMALGKAFNFLKSSMGAGAQKEMLEVQFKTLLGSAEAATQRVQELNKIANETPFSNMEIMQASKMLQALTKGALAGGEGFKLIVDSAAALDPQQFQNIAMHTGRLYAAMQNGLPLGESLGRLTELGAVSGETRAKLMEMQKTGADGAAMWAILNKELAKNKGGAENLAATFSGLKSTMSGTWTDVMADVARPVQEGMKPVMQAIIQGMETVRPIMVSMAEKLGAVLKKVADWTKGAMEWVANFSNTLMEVFANGDAGEMFKLSMIVAGKEAVNYLVSGLITGGKVFWAMMKGNFKLMFSLEYWAAIGKILGGAGMMLMSAIAKIDEVLLKGVQPVLKYIMGTFTYIGDVLGTVLLKAAQQVVKLMQPFANMIGKGDEFYNATKDFRGLDIPMPDFKESVDRADEKISGWAEGIGTGSQMLADKAGEMLVQGTKDIAGVYKNNLVDPMLDAAGSFQKLDLFGNTEEDAAKLNELWKKNEESGRKAAEAAAEQGDRMVEMQKAGGVGGAKGKDVVADTLQRVGGGGLFATGRTNTQEGILSQARLQTELLRSLVRLQGNGGLTGSGSLGLVRRRA